MEKAVCKKSNYSARNYQKLGLWEQSQSGSIFWKYEQECALKKSMHDEQLRKC